MYQFIRNVTPRNAAAVPAALQFANDITGYLNGTYGINLKCGIRLFGPPVLFWEFETESVDKAIGLNGKLMQDREYLKMLDRAKDLWVAGTMEDMIVSLSG